METSTSRERAVPAVAGILLLIFAFALLYEPWNLGGRELFRQEGFYAVQTLEMDDAMPLATAHGVAIQNAFPLYPLLGAYLNRLLPFSLEFNLRMLSLLFTAAAAVLVYLATRNVRSRLAAQAATAMFIASNIVVEKSLEAGPGTLIMLCLFAAQLLWFQGARRANWNLAWIISLAMLGIAFYAGGFIVLLFFFFPLIFMRRPLTVWPKLRKPGLAVGLLFLLGAVALWGIPYLILSNIMPLQYFELREDSVLEYGRKLLEFPFYAGLRFLPWLLVAWAPFCVALQQQDETPIFSRYLRTLVLAGFFLLWLLPGTDSTDLLILAGPLSILTGLHYEAAVRRYGRPIRFFVRLCGYFALICAGLLILFCLTPEEWLTKVISLSLSADFRNSPVFLIQAGIAVLLTGIIGIYILKRGRTRQVWLLLLASSAGLAIAYWSAMFPYRTQDRSKSEMGQILRRALEAGGARSGPDQTVYKSGIIDLYAECRYLDQKIQKINTLGDLPESPRVVFLLSTEFPQLPERTWTNLLPPDLAYMRNRLRLWKGVLRSDSLKHSGEEEEETP